MQNITGLVIAFLISLVIYNINQNYLVALIAALIFFLGFCYFISRFKKNKGQLILLLFIYLALIFILFSIIASKL